MNDIKFFCCLHCKESAGMYTSYSDKKCLICDKNCRTCEGSPNNCTSCSISSSLVSSSCQEVSYYFEELLIFHDTNTFLSDLQNSRWKINGLDLNQNLQYCGEYNIVGPFLQNDKLTYTTSFSHPHFKLRIKGRVFKIDEWGYESLLIEIDGIAFTVKWVEDPLQNNFNLFGNICQDPLYKDDISYFEFEVFHTKMVDSTISFLTNISTSQQLWGIRDIIIGIFMCDSTCYACNGPLKTDCTECFPNSYLNQSRECVCLDGFARLTTIIDAFYSKTTCEACAGTCKTCTSPNNPTSCISCFSSYYLYLNEVELF